MGVSWSDLLVGVGFVVLGILMVFCPQSSVDPTMGVISTGVGLIYLKVSGVV